jgi:hypothetical protein
MSRIHSNFSFTMISTCDDVAEEGNRRAKDQEGKRKTRIC